ncbi:hypothetical protein, partial [Streptomyces sp. NRRL F-5630]|uniref:hypothetical protein n=1 Tax=Streptomyces sp. NRRL F-5630 TaxID=1463864 RepID=UPI001F30D332
MAQYQRLFDSARNIQEEVAALLGLKADAFVIVPGRRVKYGVCRGRRLRERGQRAVRDVPPVRVDRLPGGVDDHGLCVG